MTRLRDGLLWATTILLVFPLGGHLTAADWPQFRGPGGSGRSDETGLPVQWDGQKNLAWKTQLPGPGASSPATFAGKIYMTCYSGYGTDAKNPGDVKDLTRHLLCLSPEGKVLWDSTQVATHPQEKYEGFIPLHGYASGTPAIDSSGIYVFYGTTGAAAYSFDGKQRWLTNCGTTTHEFGTGTSPVLFENLVIVNASVESGSLIALNKDDGKEVWRQKGIKMSWSTPALVKTTGGKWEVAVTIQGKVLAFDPASGERLWSCDSADDYICPSILVHDDMLYVIGGRKGRTIAIRAGGRGDVTATHKLWEVKEGSNVSSPVFHDGHLYWANESSGTVFCVNTKSGELVYKKRLEPRPGRIYASPVAADGKLYYVSRDQGAYVLAAKPDFELLAHNKIETDQSVFNGSVAVFQGKLLLRSDKFLYCIGQ
jgi:outer membrane protein assembly factor BamB